MAGNFGVEFKIENEQLTTNGGVFLEIEKFILIHFPDVVHGRPPLSILNCPLPIESPIVN